MNLSTSTDTASSCSSDTCSSSGRRPQFRYQVFLSFRGEDTRKTFTGHLYAAFSRAGVSTFLDDNELPRAENIQSKIRSAIEQSQSSVIVFSKNYAFSRWCLDELAMIMERRRMFGQIVLPVFYEAHPSHLRKQTGRVAEAFCRHETNQFVRHKVEGWRKALAEVADLAGMVLQNQAHGHEAKFIEKIVKVMEDKLSRMSLSIARTPIGIHSLVQNINFWLRNGSTEVDILGIYGMRGIGKTTIAAFLYDSNRTAFEACSFLQNISQSSRTPSGLIEMQQKLLFDLTNVKKGRIHTIGEGRRKIEDAIHCRRVLLVLDDVDHADQLDAIFMMKSQFCPGSKVIITTCNARMLRGHHQRIELHAVKTLCDTDSLKLFSWYAFGRDHPSEDFMECSKKVVDICQGLPLALKVLGSSLSGKSTVLWESTLKKLQDIPNGEIMNKLRISYESLQDTHDQNVFLHIACFFVGMDKDDVARILDSCGFHTDIGIDNIIERCLVTIDRDNKVQMHHLIQDMGREIIRSDSKDPNKLRRLFWHPNDSLKALTEKKDTQTIEGLNLDMEMVQVDRPRNSNGEVSFKTDEFSMMHKLKLLKIGLVQLNGSYEDTFPAGLIWVCWNHFSFDSLPSDFPLRSLVVLEMCYSRLKLLWRETQVLHEHGFVSTFLPGNNDITNGFMSYRRNRGSSISFTIPSLCNQSFQALNMFCLYAQSNIETPRTSTDDLKDGFPQPLMATISNKSMGKKWWYAPMFFGLPGRHGGEENILWLCHWNLTKYLKVGDRVTVSVFTGSELEVEEFGVKLLYEEDVLHFSTINVPEYWWMSFGMWDIRYMCWSTLALNYNEFSKRDWFEYLMQHSDDDGHEIPADEELQGEATIESMVYESTADEEEQREGDDMIEHKEKKEASVPVREFGSIEDCMDALEAMDGVDDEAYLKACEKFESANMRKMFLKMSEGRRRAWLNSSKKIRSAR